MFDGPEDYHQASGRSRGIDIDENTMLFMRGVGPIGYPGAAEVVNSASACATLLRSSMQASSPASEIKSLYPSDSAINFLTSLNIFVHLGISNPEVWLKERTMLIGKNEKATQQLIDLETKTSFHTSEFFKAVDNEVAMVSLPSGEHLIIAELKEITKANSELSKINTAHAKR